MGYRLENNISDLNLEAENNTIILSVQCVISEIGSVQHMIKIEAQEIASHLIILVNNLAIYW